MSTDSPPSQTPFYPNPIHIEEVVQLAQLAPTYTEPKGKYTTKITCGTCSASVFASTEWNEYFGGWKCCECSTEHKRT